MKLQKLDSKLLTTTEKAEQEEKIEYAAHSLLEVMEEMLLWSKGQMENFKPEKSSIFVVSLFQYLRNFYTGMNSIQFVFEVDDQLKVFSDENYLRTMILNLTQNAVNALKDKPDARIIWKAWQEKNSIYFSISDNGPGLSDAQISQFNNNISVSSTKTGLGFYIVKDMAQAIDCDIFIDSTEEIGTTFILVV